jgi:hypothetical protein
MKKILLLAAACILSVCAFSQSFQHGVGLGLYFDNMVPDNIGVGSSLTYNPRINFAETSTTSVSVGIPLAIGEMQNTYINDYTYSTGNLIQSVSSFMVNVPVMVNFNFGGGSSKLSRGRIGGFVGAGYGYHYVSSREYYAYDEVEGVVVKSVGGSSTGLTANAGMRIAFGRNRGKSIEIKFTWYKGTGSNKLDLYGIGAAFNF